MLSERNVQDMTYKDTVEKIIELYEHINLFWFSAEGWAPIEAASLFCKSGLDWLLSFMFY